jgi:hypothetical protein
LPLLFAIRMPVAQSVGMKVVLVLLRFFLMRRFRWRTRAVP